MVDYQGDRESLSGPSLVSPNGGEFFVGGEISITWIEPEDVDFDEILLWYEILFTHSYGRLLQTEWIQLAKIPSGNASFLWNIPSFIKSSKCRVGIRAVDYKGNRSKISFSSLNFSIREKKLPFPAVFKPVDGAIYFSYVPIVMDNKGVIDQCSQRAFYNVYYNNDDLGIEWTLLFSNIPLTSTLLYWDVKNFDSSDDYSLRVELVDEEIVSQPIFVKNITINNLNYFIIDTVPPVGDIDIINNPEYTKNRDLVVKISSYDNTSGVDEFKIEQYDIGVPDEDQPTPGPYKKITGLSTWRIKGDDGTKLIQTRIKDQAGNFILDNVDLEFFRTYQEVEDGSTTQVIVDGVSGNKNKWVTSGDLFPKLYLNRIEVADLAGPATSIIFYNSVLYIAIRNIYNRGTIQIYSGGSISTIYEMTESDSVITSMREFDNKIFMGTEKGDIWSFDGTSVSIIYRNIVFNSGVSYIGINGDILYVFYESSESFLGINKDEDTGLYNFSFLSLTI